MGREINLIVIHCSASPNGQDLFVGEVGEANFKTPVEVIDAWHAERGFQRGAGWIARFNPRLHHIGYHFVVYTNGTAATGRHCDEIGAHCYGYNRSSIGICMIGTGKYTAAQWTALRLQTLALQKLYPRARITGHRDLSPDVDGDGVVERQEWLKTCPEFDVAAWLSRGMRPDPKNVLE